MACLTTLRHPQCGVAPLQRGFVKAQHGVAPLQHGFVKTRRGSAKEQNEPDKELAERGGRLGEPVEGLPAPVFVLSLDDLTLLTSPSFLIWRKMTLKHLSAMSLYKS